MIQTKSAQDYVGEALQALNELARTGEVKRNVGLLDAALTAVTHAYNELSITITVTTTNR
jgi:hypothetical protein